MKRIITLNNMPLWCCCLIMMCFSFSTMQAQNTCVDPICGTDDPVNDLTWLNDFANQPYVCTITQYTQIADDSYFLISEYQDPMIADIPTGVLYDCDGNWICTLGGEILPEWACSFQGINLEAIGGNVIYTNGCNDASSIPGLTDNCYSECLVDPDAICTDDYTPVCGCDGLTYGNACEALTYGNACEAQTAGIITWTTGECCNEIACSVSDPVNNLAWLNDLANQSNICTITQYTLISGDSYFLVSEYQDPMIADIEIGILYDCEGNGICLLGGETTLDAQCDFQGIDLEALGGSIIYTNGCNDASPIPGLADDCYSACLVDSDLNCISVYEPVCGCDGQTYSNACFAEQAGIISWTTGECGNPVLVLAPRVFLQGALMNTTDGMMRDDLRQGDLIPVLEPYNDLDNFGHVGTGGGETTIASVLDNSGPDAIVDWVYIELRSETDPAQVLFTRSALLQRDGDVVSQDGVSPVIIQGLNAADYYVAIKHRNHLGAMTDQPISLSSSASTIDFSTIPTWGDNAQVDMGGYNALWGGNVNSDGAILFQGVDNELNDSFFEILGASTNIANMPNYIYVNYNQSDIDLNAESIYQGVGNDINMIFFNIITHPESSTFSNYIITEQIP